MDKDWLLFKEREFPILSPSKSKFRRGFSLVEVLVSVLILGIALVALLGSFVMGKRGAAVAKHYTEANNHARAAMEQYLSNRLTTYVLPDGDIKSLEGVCGVVPENYDTGIDRVVVTVSWKEPAIGGMEQECRLVTLVRE